MTELIGRSPQHHALIERLSRVARSDTEVLICGPTGVGKELYARFVHEQSGRAQERFVAVNCGAIPAPLFENELFGHIAGAFTGAAPRSSGLVEGAHRGTLMLDELDALTAENQVKLLRFVQEREFRRLGDARVRRVDVRIVSATNADLAALVASGRFRADLFFRLRVVAATVAPLRERAEDIDPLVDHFIAMYAARYSLPSAQLLPAARARLRAYHWPGNIRELENCIRSLTCEYPGQPIGPDRLSLVEAPPPSEPKMPLSVPDGDLQRVKREVVARFERMYLERALRRARGNVSHAARESGKDRRAFFELMRKYGIDPQRYRSSSDEMPHSSR